MVDNKGWTEKIIITYGTAATVLVINYARLLIHMMMRFASFVCLGVLVSSGVIGRI